MKKPPLNLIKSLQLARRSKNDSPIGIFFQTPYMTLILANHRRNRINMFQTQHASYLGSNLAQDSFKARNHNKKTIELGTTRGKENLRKHSGNKRRATRTGVKPEKGRPTEKRGGENIQ